MKTASELFSKLRENSPGHIRSEHGPGRKTRKGENTRSEHGPDAVEEQHAEQGKFKPVKPHNVKSVVGVSPRPTSDSANVKLKEETMELNEGKMGQIHSDIGQHLDKHISDFKSGHLGMDQFGKKVQSTHGHIAKLHGLEQKHAVKHVNDYVDSKLNEGMELAIETKKLSTAEKLNRGLKRGGYDSDAAQNKIKEIQKKLADQEKQYKAQGTLKEAEYWKNRGWQKKMADAAKKQNKKENLPFTPDEPSKTQAVAGKHGSGYSTARHLARMAARKAAGLKEETLEEGRPSQRHPLEGHDYHKKTNAELLHIAKDAHAAAEAMKSHNTDAENKYRDQASDSATVRHWRKMNGTPAWYQKKYGIKESNDMCPICGQTPCNCTTITEAWNQPDYNQSIKARQSAADKMSRRAKIVKSVHDKAKVKQKTQKEGKDEKFESDPELSTQIQNNQ